MDIYQMKRDMKWKGIKITGIPYETTIEGSIEESYIPYEVEKVLVEFLSDTRRVFGKAGVLGKIEYDEIEKVYKIEE